MLAHRAASFRSICMSSTLPPGDFIHYTGQGGLDMHGQRQGPNGWALLLGHFQPPKKGAEREEILEVTLTCKVGGLSFMHSAEDKSTISAGRGERMIPTVVQAPLTPLLPCIQTIRLIV